MRFLFSAAILAAMFPSVVNGAGLAQTKNFTVVTPAKPSQDAGDRFANLVAERAEKFRAEFAREWLGETLPDGGVRTIISVNFSNVENSGLTSAKNRPSQKFHNVYLRTSAEKASGTMLHHEIAHTVLATRFPHPNRLDTWVEEGIASRYDDAYLIEVRQQEVRSWIRMGRVPQLVSLLNSQKIHSFDDTHYAAAESLVQFLITRGDKQTLLRFAAMGQRDGWDDSLFAHYGIAGVRQLQTEWESWLRGSVQ